VLSNTIPAGGRLAGNTIYWDLPNLPLGAGGSLSFQVQVNANVPYGSSFTNFSQILSSENDLDYSDNSSRLVTSTISCAPPSVTLSPLSATKCPGDSITFTASASGSTPLSYQWRKNGSNIA